MQAIVILIGILLSIFILFLANLVLLFSIHPVVLILFIIVAIIGIISYKEWDNIFEFGSMFGIGLAFSFVSLLLIEIFAWDKMIAPLIVRSVPFYTEKISEIVYSTDGTYLIVAILLAIEEPIIIGLLFPIVFEGIRLLFVYIYTFINYIRERLFTIKYFDLCLKFVLSATRPVHENDIISIIPIGNKKYNIKNNLLTELRKRTCYDKDKNLYWNIASFNKMKKSIENTLLNTSPKPLEWLLYNIPEYSSEDYTAFKVTAIRELAMKKIFVLERTTGGSLSSDGEETVLYRHFKGSRIKSVVLEDDPDFY